MEKEINLSEMIVELDEIPVIHKKFVKEFISLESSLIVDVENNIISWNDFWLKRKRLAGRDLI